MRRAHAAYFLVLAEEGADELEGPNQSAWLARLDRDLDNLRTALDWLTKTKNAEWGLRLGASLFRYWEARELLTEGRVRLAALRKTLGTPLTGSEQRRLDESLLPLQAELKPAERSRAWIEGWAMPIEEAMEYAVGGEARGD